MTSVVEEERRAAGDEPELEHLVCCDDDVALCGADVSGDVWGPGWEKVKPEDKCVVCYAMDDYACPKCGELPDDTGLR